jgi:hypothetical protein
MEIKRRELQAALETLTAEAEFLADSPPRRRADRT